MACLETDFLIALIRKDKYALKKLRTLLAEGERITTTPITPKNDVVSRGML
jgi:tRNA(fMet)-specific endonuclease VapC